MTDSTSIAVYRESVDSIDQAIVGLTASLNATTYRLLLLVREFDERGGFLRFGFNCCADWLAWRCDIGIGAAREKVRVANALLALPETAAAFESGVLSYSKVRALTRVATAASEGSLIDFARGTTVTRVEERCRQLRNVQPVSIDDANRAHARRSLTFRRDAERGVLVMTVELPIEDGELVDQALARVMEQESPETPELAADPFAARQADALVSMARASLLGDGSGKSRSADAYQVVVHVDESALLAGEGRSDLPLETVRRLTCDGTIVPVVENAEGEPLNIGRKRRTIPTAIRRAVDSRDRECRFPGCRNRRFLETHHVMHWSDGGETSVDNLVKLCTRHHRMHHEGRFTIEKGASGDWIFRRPDGRVIPECGYQLDDMIDDEVQDPILETELRRAADSWVTR